MTEIDRGDASAKFQRLIETIDIANLLTEPLRHSIAKLLEISASEIDAAEASVLIRDGADGDLRFLVVVGKVAEKLTGLVVPAGKGIAGFVFSSGQPMVVSDVAGESAFYSEVDKTTGFSTEMILATPLSHRGEMIGVLEYVNRKSKPALPFSPEEMDRAAVFAEAVAALVAAYESAKVLRALADHIISDDDRETVDELRSWLVSLRESASHREMMDLAILLQELVNRGEAERKICRELLNALLDYSNSKADAGYLGL